MTHQHRFYANELFIILLAFGAASCDKNGDGIPDRLTQIPANAVVWLPGNGIATDVMSNREAVLSASNPFGKGKVGLGFRFDGMGSSGMLADTLTLDIRSSLSLLCWVKLDTPLALQPSYAYYSDYPFLVSKGNGDYNQRNYGLYFDKPRNTLHFNGIDSLGTNYVFSVAVTTAGQYFDDLGWHLVGATWNRATLKASIYIDGQTVSTADGTNTSLATNDFPLMLAAGNAYANHIRASIDEVMVFNRSLSAAEVLLVYNSGSDGCVK